jgi:hypothetical protein
MTSVQNKTILKKLLIQGGYFGVDRKTGNTAKEKSNASFRLVLINKLLPLIFIIVLFGEKFFKKTFECLT